MMSAACSGLSGSKNSTLSPPTSRKMAVSAAPNGTPACCASISGSPKPSSLLALIAQRACASAARYWSSVAPSYSTTRLVIPRLAMRASISGRLAGGNLPHRCSVTSGTSAAASIKHSTFLYGVNAPMNMTPSIVACWRGVVSLNSSELTAFGTTTISRLVAWALMSSSRAVLLTVATTSALLSCHLSGQYVVWNSQKARRSYHLYHCGGVR